MTASPDLPQILVIDDEMGPRESLRMLLKRGCVRQTGCAPDGAPIYVLP